MTTTNAKATKRRRYQAAIGDNRCKVDRLPLSDGTGARCMKPAVVDGMCRQHAKIHAAKAEARR